MPKPLNECVVRKTIIVEYADGSQKVDMLPDYVQKQFEKIDELIAVNRELKKQIEEIQKVAEVPLSLPLDVTLSAVSRGVVAQKAIKALVECAT